MPAYHILTQAVREKAALPHHISRCSAAISTPERSVGTLVIPPFPGRTLPGTPRSKCPRISCGRRAAPRRIDVPIAAARLAVRVEALRMDQVQLVPGPGHGDVEEALSLLFILSAAEILKILRPAHLIPMLSICGLRLFGAMPQATRGPPVSDLPIRRTCRKLANPPPGVFYLRGIVIRRLPCVGPDRQFSLCPSFLAFSVSSPMVHRASPCDVG